MAINLSNTYIKTERLIIRNLQTYDAYDVFDMFKNEKVANPACLKVHTNEAMSEYFLMQTIEYGDTLAIELEDERKMIGWISIMEFDSQDLGLTDDYEGYEIGYSINFNYWNRGYASEAVKSVIEMCFNELDISYLICEYLFVNKRSENLAKKFNFKFLTNTKIEDDNHLIHKGIRTILVNKKNEELYEYIKGR